MTDEIANGLDKYSINSWWAYNILVHLKNQSEMSAFFPPSHWIVYGPSNNLVVAPRVSVIYLFTYMDTLFPFCTLTATDGIVKNKDEGELCH